MPRPESAREGLSAATQKVARSVAEAKASDAANKAEADELEDLDALLQSMIFDDDEPLSTGFASGEPGSGAPVDDPGLGYLEDFLPDLCDFGADDIMGPEPDGHMVQAEASGPAGTTALREDIVELARALLAKSPRRDLYQRSALCHEMPVKDLGSTFHHSGFTGIPAACFLISRIGTGLNSQTSTPTFMALRVADRGQHCPCAGQQICRPPAIVSSEPDRGAGWPRSASRCFGRLGV